MFCYTTKKYEKRSGFAKFKLLQNQRIMTTLLDRIEYLMNLCDQCIKSRSNPPLLLQRINKDSREFLECYTKNTIFEIIKKANNFRDRALKVFEYRCIKYSMFILPRLNKTAKFITEIRPKLLSSKQASILDIGCCFGTDLRYCLYSGCNKTQILGVDISKEFINLGFEFYGDKHELNDRFFTMDIFHENGKRFINHAIKLNDNEKFDVIYIGSVYHLLSKEQCKSLTQIASSLIKESDGIIFGGTVGVESKPGNYPRSKQKMRYLHTKDSFEIMLKSNTKFRKVSVNVNSRSVQAMTRYRKSIEGETHYSYFNFYIES